MRHKATVGFELLFEFIILSTELRETCRVNFHSWLMMIIHLSSAPLLQLIPPIFKSDHYYQWRCGRKFNISMKIDNLTGAEVTDMILTVAPVSAGGVVCLGLGVKASSDPWLTQRTPTMTAVSSEKRLWGYVQSLESTSRITTRPISHRANVADTASITVTAVRGVSITVLRGFLHHVTACNQPKANRILEIIRSNLESGWITPQS